MGERPGYKAGMAAFKRLSPEDQERFRDWTPGQLQAFLPLLADEPPDEERAGGLLAPAETPSARVDEEHRRADGTAI